MISPTQGPAFDCKRWSSTAAVMGDGPGGGGEVVGVDVLLDGSEYGWRIGGRL